MAKKRLRVQRAWAGWADEIANRVVYGTFGRTKRRLENRQIHRFLRARAEWNRYVRALAAEDRVSKMRAINMFGCRYQGVVTNVAMPKRACHHGFCPYCYYSWLTGFLRKNKLWAKSERIDVAVLTLPIDRQQLENERSNVDAIAHVRRCRSRLVERLRTDHCSGASTCWLWPYKSPDGTLHFVQRVVVIGLGLDRSIEPPAAGELSVFFDVEAKEAWRALQYRPLWLKIPYNLGLSVVAWNSAIRTTYFAGSPSRRIQSWT